MDYRFLGNSGLRVSILSFGAMTFGGAPAIGATSGQDAVDQVRLCLDAGVNLFDTADMYGDGRSEEVLAAALGRHRDDVVLATKAHGRMGDGPNDVGQSRFHIMRAVDNSLRRLKTDRIDLYQMHGFDGRTPLEETLGALDNLVTSGKVRYIGCSNYSGWQLMKALAVADGVAPRRSSASRCTTRFSPVSSNTSWCRSLSTKGSARWCGRHFRAVCSRGSIAVMQHLRRARGSRSWECAALWTTSTSIGCWMSSTT